MLISNEDSAGIVVTSKYKRISCNPYRFLSLAAVFSGAFQLEPVRTWISMS